MDVPEHTVSIFPMRTYPLTLLVLGGALAVSFIHRSEYFDDAWFAEQAYWLIHAGHVRSELFRGLNGWEHQLYVFHKLFIFTEALILSVLGVSVGSSKVIGVLFGLVGLILVWQYPVKANPEQRWLGVLLYLGCGTLIQYICLNRPETMCMALGFSSFYVLTRTTNQRTGVFWAGILAGAAALTHLNGLAYMGAGAFFLLIRDGWRCSIGYSIVSGIGLSLYTVDAALNHELPLLLSQFATDPATQEGLHLTDKLTIMAKYHELFFHSENEAALTILVMLCLLVFRRHLRWAEPVLLYTALLLGSFWLLTKGNTDIYFLLFLPWFALLVAELAARYIPQLPRWQQQTSRLLLVGYLLLATVRLGMIIAENIRTPDTKTQNARLAAFMPKRHTNVIAPLEFFFGQMENYRIRGLTYYKLLSNKGPGLSLPQFFELAEQDGATYIIGEYGRTAAYPIPANAPATIGVYHRIYQDQWNSLYARQAK